MNDFESTLEGRSLICIAETPLHLLGILCLLSAVGADKIKTCDLLIRRTVPLGERGMSFLVKSSIFDNIVFVDSDAALPCRCPGLLYNNELRFFLKKRREHLFRSCPTLEGREYDTLIIGTINTLARDVKRFTVTNGTTIVIDDGKGSHDGSNFDYLLFLDDIVAAPFPVDGIAKKCKRLLKKGMQRFAKPGQFLNVDSIFLFWQGENEGKVYKNVSLHRLDPGVVSAAAWHSFATRGQYEDYSNAHSVFLTLPNEEISVQSLNAEERLIGLMLDRLDGSVVRKHYRRDDNGLERYADRFISNEPSWEALILSGAINSNDVLFGCCSSAQVMPKILTGEEPVLVFLHRLIPDLEESEAFEAFSNYARKMYSDETKVMVPCSMKEFTDCLEFASRL